MDLVVHVSDAKTLFMLQWIDFWKTDMILTVLELDSGLEVIHQ